MSELRGNLVVYGSRHMCGDHLLLLYREKPVAVDADDGTFCLYASECLFDSSTSATDGVAVYRSAERVV